MPLNKEVKPKTIKDNMLHQEKISCFGWKSMQHSCVVVIKLFSLCFVNIHEVHQYSSTDIATAWKKSHCILLDFPNQNSRKQSTLLFTYSWRGENWCIHAFRWGISAKWNANNFNKDLNLSNQFLFPRWINIPLKNKDVTNQGRSVVPYISNAIILMDHHHHHQVVPPARISLTLSRHFSLSFIASGRSSVLHPVSSYSCCMYVRAGHPAFARPYVGVHRTTSFMSSSLLLQQCPACLVHLTWIVFMMGSRWSYSWCLVGCCLQDCSILLATFLCNCHLASSPAILLASKWCIHTAVTTWPLPGRNCVSFYRSGLTSIWLIAYW